MILKSIIKGLIALLAILAVYFTVVGLISGKEFALEQFFRYWYFMVSLAAGFGIQIGLYSYLRSATLHQNASGGVVAVSGTTSTVAMISCCAHYLANILPVIGITGAIAIIGQYQIELFWIGLLSNIVGIAYIGNKIIKFRNDDMMQGMGYHQHDDKDINRGTIYTCPMHPEVISDKPEVCPKCGMTLIQGKRKPINY